MGKTYWMLVTTGENFEITRSRGFDIQGIDSSQRRKALRLNNDDRIVFYLSDKRRFAATATVASSHFEDHTRVWKHYKESEVFPHRVKIRADSVLPTDRYLDAYQIGPRLEYVRKWPPEEWELAFIGGLHIIPQKDFAFLEDEMRRELSSAPDGVRSQRRRRNRRGRRRGQHNESGRGEAMYEAGAGEAGEDGGGEQEPEGQPYGEGAATPEESRSQADGSPAMPAPDQPSAGAPG